MTIRLPDELRETLERDAAAGGFGSVDEYVASLVTESLEPIPAGEPAFRTREDLEKLLDAGMASGVAGTMDAAFWAKLKARIQARAALRTSAP